MVLCNRWIWFLWLQWFCRIAGVIVVGIAIDVMIFDRSSFVNEWTLLILGVAIYCVSAIFWVLWNDRLSRALNWVLKDGEIVVIQSLKVGAGRKVAPYIAERLVEIRGEAMDLALAMASKSETPSETFNFVSGLPVSNSLAKLESRGKIEIELRYEILIVFATGLGCLLAELLMNGLEGRLLYAFLIGIALRLATLLAVPKRKELDSNSKAEIEAILSNLSTEEVRELKHFGFVGKSASRLLLKNAKETLL